MDWANWSVKVLGVMACVTVRMMGPFAVVETETFRRRRSRCGCRGDRSESTP